MGYLSATFIGSWPADKSARILCLYLGVRAIDYFLWPLEDMSEDMSGDMSATGSEYSKLNFQMNCMSERTEEINRFTTFDLYLFLRK